MMVSLFSVFDPVSFLGISLNWVVLLVLVFFFPFSFYYSKSSSMELLEKVEVVLSDIYSEASYPYFRGLLLVSFVVFMGLVVLNVIGLFSYVFSSTGHLIVTLSLGVIFWMMGVMMGWLNMFSKSSAHLVPEGAPLLLAPFMVLVESVSQIIRPVTLSVRLAANMMAGHLIIGLISSISGVSFSVFWVSVMLQSLMLILEWAVCFIQAFVFSILVALYSLDYY